jgi:hypothetical protein
MDARIIEIIDNLAAYLRAADTRARYPRLDRVSINSWDNPVKVRYPYLDIYPLDEEPLGADADGTIAEHATSQLQFICEVQAPKYQAAVRQAFNIADELRITLNSNLAAVAVGARWIRRGRVQQAQPDIDKQRAFVVLQGEIAVHYSIQGK